MTAPFDRGYVPRGWRPGEALLVQSPTEARPGFVMQKEVSFRSQGTDIAVVSFQLGEQARVAEWLQWWLQFRVRESG